MKRLISIFLVFILGVGASFAETLPMDTTGTVTAEPGSIVPLKNFTFQDFLIVATVICVILLCFIIIRLLVVLNLQVKRLAKARATNDPNAVLDEPSRFETSLQKFYGLKPLSMEGELIMDDHEYDGIVELKNGMPPWLQAFFAVTVLFAISYWTYYMVLGVGPDQYQEYQTQVDIANKKKEERNKMYANSIDENNVELTTEAADLDKGKSIFIENCATCHKETGGGDSGPNLTDQYWIHGGGIKNIFKTVKYGFVEKGMPGWSDKLNPLQIKQVASYVMSLQGSNPPGAKEPKGELWVEQEIKDSTGAKTDSLNIEIKDSLK